MVPIVEAGVAVELTEEMLNQNGIRAIDKVTIPTSLDACPNHPD